jgi:hypothetical protein
VKPKRSIVPCTDRWHRMTPLARGQVLNASGPAASPHPRPVRSQMRLTAMTLFQTTQALGVLTGGNRPACPFVMPGSLESQALWLGMLDHASGLPDDSRIRRMIRVSFGLKKPTPLADARLEAIRSIVLALRVGSRRKLRSIAADALANGVTSSEMLWLIRNVAPKRCNELRDFLAPPTGGAVTPRTCLSLRRAPARVPDGEQSQPAFAA